MPSRKTTPKAMTAINSFVLADNVHMDIAVHPVRDVLTTDYEPHPKVQRVHKSAHSASLYTGMLETQEVLSKAYWGVWHCIVSPDGNKRWIIDGQHRLAAAMSMKQEIDSYQAAQQAKAEKGEHPATVNPYEEQENALNGPVTIITFKGLDETQERHLFSILNLGRKIDTNLLVAFGANYSGLLDWVNARDWVDTAIGATDAKSPGTVYGMKDLRQALKTVGGLDDLDNPKSKAMLKIIESVVTQVTASAKEKNADPFYTMRVWGSSVRLLTAYAKVIKYTTEEGLNAVVESICRLIPKTIAEGGSIARILPVYTPTDKGFKLLQASVVDRKAFFWVLNWVIQDNAGCYIHLPASMSRILLNLSYDVPEGVGYDVNNPDDRVPLPQLNNNINSVIQIKMRGSKKVKKEQPIDEPEIEVTDADRDAFNSELEKIRQAEGPAPTLAPVNSGDVVL